ncbi:hypothetical protein GCM10023317_89570 [Actinopolymorpha pittospori]|uniref:K+-transporting ATPase KdpF subunit n=1 Tax=Actinopolymorpha pittospori TaxID=648752 RepID=A0A927N8F4_9ACTN|nr:K+-transporting ATPase KdpF subunit [Actinopolymorpha pittospori]
MGERRPRRGVRVLILPAGDGRSHHLWRQEFARRRAEPGQPHLARNCEVLVTLENVAALVVAVVLAGYLLSALIVPERF